MLPVATGNIPDLVVRSPECYQDKLVRFRTSLCEVRNVTRIFGNIPDLAGNIPDLVGNIPDLKFASLVTFRTSTDEVRNITKIPWCFSGPRSLRSGILPIASGNIPDLTHRGPECYQEENLRSGMLPTRSGMLPARSGMLPTRSGMLPKILVI